MKFPMIFSIQNSDGTLSGAKAHCKMLRFVTLLLVSLSGGLALSLCAQDKTSQWATVTKALRFQRDSIKSLKGYVQFECYFGPQFKKQHEVNTQRAFKGKAPDWETTPNRLYSYAWSVQDKQWRCERRQIFPTKPTGQHPVEFAVYDGEKLYSYDALQNAGHITSSDGKVPPSHDFLGHHSDVFYYSLGWLDLLEIPAGQRPAFQLEREEKIKDRLCQKFVAQDSNNQGAFRLTCWVCPSLNFAIVKMTGESFGVDKQGKATGDGSLLNLSADDFVQVVSDIWLPKQTKRELFDITALRLKWSSSQIFTFTELEVNKPIPDHLFKVHFPPGTLVGDETTQANYMVGGTMREKNLKMKANQNPANEFKEGDVVLAFGAK